MFDERESLRYSAFALLIGVIEMLEAESLAVSKQFQEITSGIATRNDHDVCDSGIHQCLNWVVDHRLIVNGKQMFVCYGSERTQSRTQATSEYNTFHYTILHSAAVHWLVRSFP